MKRMIFPVAVFLGVVLMGGCRKDDGLLEPAPESPYFNFATTKVCNLNVEYRLKGYRTGILFEVYSENPYEETYSGAVKREDVKPVFKAYTNAAGHFDGEMQVPAGLKTAYLVTDALGVPGCVKAPVNGSRLSVDMNIDYLATKDGATRTIVQGPNHKYPDAYSFLDNKDDWNMLGVPSYLNPNGRMVVPTGLISDIGIVLPPGENLTTSTHSYLLTPGVSHSIAIKETTTVNMVFIIDGADYRSVVGYYTYPTGTPPQKPGDIKRMTAVFPNASAFNSGGELVAGDNVRLKYWNEARQQYEENFPAGVTIGFFMHTNVYDPTSGNIADVSSSKPVYYSDSWLNYYGTSFAENLKQQTVAMFDYSESGRQLVVIGFEDARRPYGASDHDFNDVMFYIKTNPVTAIDVPEGRDPDLDPDPEQPKPYTIEYEGCLGFEDNWPCRGDYDMNDVGIKYHSTVYYTPENRIEKIIDVIAPVAKGATYINGFGYQYGVEKSAVKNFSIKVSPEKNLPYTAFEEGQRLATVMLFDNVRDEVDGKWNITSEQQPKYTYTVTTVFITPQVTSAVGFPPYNPFIVVNRPGETPSRNREVHLPGYRPTDKATGPESQAWFGHYQDRSNAAQNLWYISEDNYPFAIHIPNYNFRFPDEYVKIDEAYPKFADWARSHGTLYPDWYK